MQFLPCSDNIFRNEIYAQRQRAEVEAEQNRAIEKALIAERKAERIAAAQRVTMDYISKQKQADEPKKVQLAEYKRSLTPSPRFGDSAQDEPKLEWWEKKASWNERGKSPALPAMRSHKEEENNNDENFLSNNADDDYPHPQMAVANRRRMDSASSSSHTLSLSLQL
uniref:Uncharacterized protein n=1 Tax=Ditylenchus dipsaci TaxID=166011 RepID=A0A915EPV2_9BILA